MGSFYYTYVLLSLKDNYIYIGWSNDLKKRLLFHNLGKVSVTKNRVPFKLIYYEACLSKDKAIEREKTLKTGFGRKYLKNRIVF
jgi:putative endonuclease